MKLRRAPASTRVLGSHDVEVLHTSANLYAGSVSAQLSCEASFSATDKVSANDMVECIASTEWFTRRDIVERSTNTMMSSTREATHK